MNERSLKLIEPLGANPEASVNAALQGWGDTAAAYRFFDNPKVTPEEIVRPHRTATLERMRQESVALVLQDTTELDLTDHPPDDARCLNKPERFGLYDHTHLAVTPGRVSLGVVGMKLFDRDPETLGQTAERSSWPIEEKESFRWLQGYRLACDLQQQCPDTQVVSVADREGDLYDIFVAAAEHQSPADFLIRSKESRCTPERDPASGAAAYRKMRDEVSESVLRYRKTLDLPATPKRAARPAEIEVRARTVTLKPPHARGQLPSVTINVIQAVEVNGPGDGTDVEWWLLTSLPIETFEELERALDDYAARWTIEVYFRVLKTGCRVEEIQLETKSRFSNGLAFYQIIAWRVMHVTHQSRESPDVPCSMDFTRAEWKSVWRITTGVEATSPPSLSEFTKQLATLGGYNKRKNDGPPGPESLWTALRRMNDFALAWLTFNPTEQTCV